MSQVLLSSAARTASGSLDLLGASPQATPNFDAILSALFVLDVTSAAAGAGDLLDVFLQHSPDETAAWWDDFVRFTQVLGNGGAKRFIASWRRDGALPESEMRAPADGTMAAGVLNGPVGPRWRIRWIVTNGGGPSFTFSVRMTPNFRA